MLYTCASCGREWNSQKSLTQHRKGCKKYKTRLEAACAKDPTGSRPTTRPEAGGSGGWRVQIPRRDDVSPEGARANLRRELNEVRIRARRGHLLKGERTCTDIPLSLLTV